MADRFWSRKKSSASTSDSGNSSGPAAKKSRRQVNVSTFEKWQRQLDKDYRSLSWLQCTKDSTDRSMVSTLFCEVCRQYERKIECMRNYSAAWVKGSLNHQTSNILDHAKSEQHTASMAYLRTATAKASNLSIQSYAPIAHFLLTMDCAKLFVRFIAEAQRNCFLQSISTETKFISFFMDGFD